MNFFEQQDKARKTTVRLVILFVLTVLVLIAAFYAVVLMITVPAEGGSGLWQPGILLIVAVGTVMIVGLGTGYKLMALSFGGGAKIAEQLGGRQLDPGSTEPLERRLLNTVEEMALASGVPTPTVYVLNEEGINAFAAGFSPETAVIGVTRGCMELLTRDQLQGVMAHEFSHILNGDMNLNLRLIGVLHGILVISYIGQGLMRTMFYSNALGGRRSKKQGGAGGVMAIALAMMVLGWIGVFFGSLIKAAISRQREFLADASAVQFTRNPEGIGGALKAIGAHSKGAAIEAPNAAEASHLFFGQGITSMLGSPFATHPPLSERISRVLPGWDGDFGPQPQRKAVEATDTVEPESRSNAGAALRNLGDLIGHPGTTQIAIAAALLESMPQSVMDSVRNPCTARGVIYSLLLSAEGSIRAKQLKQLQSHADPAVITAMNEIVPLIGNLAPQQRLPLLGLAVPALKTLSLEQYATFKQVIMKLVGADNRVHIDEWVVMVLIRHHLEPTFSGRQDRGLGRPKTLEQCSAECTVLLSAIVHFGVTDDQHSAAHTLAAKRLPIDISHEHWADDWNALDEALATLQSLAPDAKLNLLQTCADCILVDKNVPIEAAELLRAVSELLGCPMPPLQAG